MTPLLVFYSFVLGALFGSFLNVIVIRTHDDESWWSGRSHCPHSNHTLTWYELIPIVSYAIQGGKCRSCHTHISWQYPIVEVVTGSLFVLAYLSFGLSLRMVLADGILWLLWGSFLSDLKYMELYEILTIPAIVLSALYQFLYGGGTFLTNIAGIAFGGLFFFLQYFFTKGKGLGDGDIRLGLQMGALLGWPLVLVSIMLAYVGGSIISLILMGLKRISRKSMVPLGVFLIPATVVVFFNSSSIMRYLEYSGYLSILG